ncbi:MAG: DNA mismatch repair protein MutS [Candidatus Obscuribacterales bacterium]|nr:DNA mismatch repair protein MutS [Candidatus Obscuribacterales bacterium]
MAASEKSEKVENLSPMMRQYWDVKAQYPESLLLFRVGDFYELFDTDARVAARELDITLTGRPEPSYPNGRMPMAGVPYRAVDAYLARLLAKGYSVAICEQVGVVGAEKGPIERQVSRVLTPGTVLESHLLPSRENNYLVSIVRGGSAWGLACVDASCGEFMVTQLEEADLLLELGRLSPKEILVPLKVVKPGPGEVVPKEVADVPEGCAGQYRITGRPSMFFQFEPAQRRVLETFGVSTLEGFGCQDMPLAVSAAGAIIEYLERTQGAQRPTFQGVSAYSVAGHLVLDPNTRRNLELTETSRERTFEGSLLWTIDKTSTAMGGRMLRKWLLRPLLAAEEITARQDAVEELSTDGQQRHTISQLLSGVSDLERLAVRLTSGTISPKDLVAIKCSLSELPKLAVNLAESRSSYLNCVANIPSTLAELESIIAKTIGDDPPREITEGGIFRDGYSEELDEIRSLLGGGKDWIDKFQVNEQERTGVKSLKVGFNRTFGYFIEVTRANQEHVPDDYIRKQTLSNAERYITPELKEYEARILNAEKNQSDVEFKMFQDLRKQLTTFGSDLNFVANMLASVDALLSLSKVAHERRYVRPVVDRSHVIEITDGRHPVLESILPMGKYVANNTRLLGQSDDHQLVVLTGPNMSGKSSYLRQVALITILAQMGSFVPAETARIGLVDRIFTRIGAVDDLTQGQSTFLVEMSETTQCCRSATDRSLILLDEVGRGTSTYDGVAIAWSVAEFLAKVVRARTIFATHYHELNGLANFLPQIVNYQVLVTESDGHVEFIRSVVPGGASRSFGVQVAKMAGLPSQVIDRAQYLINQMEKRGVASKILDGPRMRNIPMDEVMQLSLFETVKNCDPNDLSQKAIDSSERSVSVATKE